MKARLLQQWITAQAEHRPDATAIVHAEERWSYGDLDQRSTQLARLLKEQGCAKGDRVCLLMPKSPQAVLAMLGTLKADAIYVPLDPQSPPSRLRRVMESCECRWLLAGGTAASLLDEIFRVPFSFPVSIGRLGEEKGRAEEFGAAFSSEDFSSYPSEPLDYRHRPEDPAHILFTSGSTGTPKGVVILHSSVIHFVEWATRYFGMSSSDRISGHSPLHFDLSTFDIYGTFAVGAGLHLVPPELNIVPQKLADFIRKSELTQWFSVPSILNYMAKFDVVQFDDFPALREFLWCGEVLPTPSLIYWMKRLPHARFTNLYGPTEATVASSYYTVPKCPEDERTPIPMGTACPGEELLVLDDALEPVAPGQVGNLHIRGAGLSPGYWREPEKTAAVFLPNPRGSDPSDRIYKTGDLARTGEDGLVYFVGRSDFQIKSRGYRIELGEIEAGLNSIEGLQECAVVAVPIGGFEGNRICCAYVALPDCAITPITLRKELSRLVPPYMLPMNWLAMKSLPKNGNGKIDRPKLAEMFREHKATAA